MAARFGGFVDYFNFSKIELDYEPYPVGLVSDLIGPSEYKQLVDNFPDRSLFLYRPNYGKKWALSELDNPKAYFDFIKNNPAY